MNIFGPYPDGPLTGRITPGFGPGPVLSPQHFDSGWQEPQPAGATPSGHGGKMIRRIFGLDRGAEAAVAAQLIDAPQSDERNALYAEWDDLNQRIRNFLTSVHEAQIADLRVALEGVLAQGREAHDELKACVAEVGEARAQVNAHLELLSRARTKLKTVEGSRPDPESWPTELELTEHEVHVVRARDRANLAEQRHAELVENLNIAQARTRTARGKLQALREQRDQLKAAIAGQPLKGPFGLITPGTGS